jgi:signal transduction histidine kinase
VKDAWNEVGARSATTWFDPTVQAPIEARRFVSDTARSWGLGDVASIAELLVSELVTNAVRHGRTGGELRIDALPAGLRVVVVDRGGGVPAQRRTTSDDVTGRGLAVVAALSRRWGTSVSTGFTEVWFELDDVDPLL